MDPFTRTRASVIAICSIATALILWLSASFWVDAWQQFRNARDVQHVALIEGQILDITASLAAERSQLATRLSTDGAQSATATQSAAAGTDTLERHRQATDRQLATVLPRVGVLVDDPQLSGRLQQARGALQVSIIRVRAARQRLQKTRLAQQKMPDPESTHAAMLAVTHLVDQLHVLQEGLTLQPRTSTRELSQLRGLQTSVRDFGELFSRDLGWQMLNLVTDDQDIALQDSPLHVPWQQAQQHIVAMQRYRTAIDADVALQKSMDTLVAEWQARGSGQATTGRSEVSLLRDDARLRAELNQLNRDVGATIMRQAASRQAHGIRRLVIDSLLLLAGLWMVFASIRLMVRIQHQALHDRVTELPNRFYIEKILDDALKTAESDNVMVGVMVIDIDDFRSVNDSLGHAVGDELLHAVGQRLRDVVPSTDALGVVSADEYAVILYGEGTAARANRLSERLLECCDEQFVLGEARIRVTLSIGLCVAEASELSSREFLSQAEIAMRQAKDDGKARGRLFDSELAGRHRRRVQLGVDLRNAIADNQLELYYQPKVCTRTGKVDGAEALLRWHHPNDGMVSPFEFIPVAEACGLICNIGDWVLDEACRQNAEWKGLGLCLQVAVNVSAEQFIQDDFVERVRATLRRHAVNPQQIEIELTESVGMHDLQTVVKCLTALRQDEISIAIDDFGTDYSSLQYLEDLPLDNLKIDRAFVSKLDEPATEHKLVNTIVLMAQGFNLKTVAEGVETVEQLDKVIALGCDHVQGYYYSKPVPAAEIPNVIERIQKMSRGRRGRQAGSEGDDAGDCADDDVRKVA